MSLSIADLQAFADAWNRHDIEALMRFMTDD
jgi:ketosteroid isomerase-like protein